jgi:hypothetical protein
MPIIMKNITVFCGLASSQPEFLKKYKKSPEVLELSRP